MNQARDRCRLPKQWMSPQGRRANNSQKTTSQALRARRSRGEELTRDTSRCGGNDHTARSANSADPAKTLAGGRSADTPTPVLPSASGRWLPTAIGALCGTSHGLRKARLAALRHPPQCRAHADHRSQPSSPKIFQIPSAGRCCKIPLTLPVLLLTIPVLLRTHN